MSNDVIGMLLVFIVICIIILIYQSKLDRREITDHSVKVVAKRSLVKGNYTYTSYFVTFEFDENKERIELQVSGEDFGLLAEGDIGTVYIQVDTFIRFERVKE